MRSPVSSPKPQIVSMAPRPAAAEPAAAGNATKGTHCVPFLLSSRSCALQRPLRARHVAPPPRLDARRGAQRAPERLAHRLGLMVVVRAFEDARVQRQLRFRR